MTASTEPRTRIRTAVLLLAVALAAVLSALPAGVASAAILEDAKELGWASHRDLTSERFSELFDHYSDAGLLLIDFDAYPEGDGARYSMVWRRNTDGRGWALHRGLTWEQYAEWWRYYRDLGYRPHDTEAYRIGGTLYWAGIWVQNRERLAWASHRGLDGEGYDEVVASRRAGGYRLIDVEGYDTAAGLRYAQIWLQSPDSQEWLERRDMTRAEYQAEVDTQADRGFTVVDFESYATAAGPLYAAVWERKPGFDWQVRSDRSALGFANLWRRYTDEGYRLVDFERYETGDGTRYGGVWIENRSRYRYERKGEIDAIVESYRDAIDLPGISVAIVRDGALLYRRGFGFADVDAGKVAHGTTVYNTASVSKPIGGTLAAKLEDEGVLRDGTPVSVDLTLPTSIYLADLPEHHTHTVEQLFSHLSCVVHYNTDPAGPNPTDHFATASESVQEIWDLDLVQTTRSGTSPCVVGSTWSYSTHAFTFAGAVLEAATGRAIDRLLDEELFEPYFLTSLRTQFAEPDLPASYDRAVPYDGSNSPVSYRDSSWKVLGGGVEGHVVDLAWFGWMALDARIVSPAARDRMWTRVHPNRSHGLGWSVVTDPSGRRVAEWNGSARGARSYLRVYRDDGLVVAVASNRSSHPKGAIRGLADDLGDAVLD